MVNDVFINDKKVSGSLLENTFTEKGANTFMGIGVNLNSKKEDFANLPEASSIGIETGRVVDVNDFYHNLTQAFFENLKQMNQQGFSPIFTQIEKNMEFINQNVVILDPINNQILERGIFQKLNPSDGSAIISLENGEVKTILYGRMRKMKD